MPETPIRGIQSYINIGLFVLGGIFAGRYLFPKIKIAELTVPVITTKYDTVETTPAWLTDSIKKWKKATHTTDTINLVITETVIDTEYVYVGSDTARREDIWPVLSYHGGRRFGDTATVITFSLRDGRGNVSQAYIPGILTAIEMDSGKPTPKLTFAPFPAEEKHGWFYPIKNFLLGGSVGLGACSLLK